MNTMFRTGVSEEFLNAAEAALLTGMFEGPAWAVFTEKILNPLREQAMGALVSGAKTMEDVERERGVVYTADLMKDLARVLPWQYREALKAEQTNKE